MLFDGPQQAIENGFVSIEAAERFRQTDGLRSFRAKHEAEYQRVLKAAIFLKRAHQELEAAKAAIQSLPVGIAIGDLLDSVERDSREVLKQEAAAANLAQLEQAGGEATAVTKPAKKAS